MAERGEARTDGRSARLITIAAAVAVVSLALAALLWPRGPARPGASGLLVLDPAGAAAGREALWPALGVFLAPEAGGRLPVTVARTRGEFAAGLGGNPAYVVCPDGAALAVPADRYVPLVAGRRAAPRNLRPRSVLVYRKAAGAADAPWRTRPTATVVGDSFSLAATGAWRGTAGVAPAAGCAWGPDPYDHAPVLHAARLGCYDYAVVRQWDADRFFAAGLLDPLTWGEEPLTGPVPDLVVLVARDLPRSVRLAAGERLAALERTGDAAPPAETVLRRGLAAVGLEGFNLLLEPDFEGVRRGFAPDWLPGRD